MLRRAALCRAPFAFGSLEISSTSTPSNSSAAMHASINLDENLPRSSLLVIAANDAAGVGNPKLA